MLLSKKLDQLLLNLAWSLWTELGISGVQQRHQQTLILVEELILLTALLSEADPRLRDESIDWCGKYYRFISSSRLKSLTSDFNDKIAIALSKYSSTMNSISKEKWPVYSDVLPYKVRLSGKSRLQLDKSPALLNLRARALFGTGARADVLTYFLTRESRDFSISDISVIGYSKRNHAEILEDLCLGGFFDKYLQGNQSRYRLIKRDQLIALLKPLPKYAPPWRIFLQILLPLRDVIQRTEHASTSTMAVEIRNCLEQVETQCRKIHLTPPSFHNDFQAYLHAFEEWLLKSVAGASMEISSPEGKRKLMR